MTGNSIRVKSKRVECGGNTYKVMYMEDDYGWLLADEAGNVVMSNFDDPEQINSVPSGELLYQQAEDIIDNDAGHSVDWDELPGEVRKIFGEWADTDWVWDGTVMFDENADEELV